MIGAQEGGPSLLLLLLLVVWSGDTAAYYVGKSIGRRKLAPKLSPNKTWEGTIASVAGSLVITVRTHSAGEIPYRAGNRSARLSGIDVELAVSGGDPEHRRSAWRLGRICLKRGAGVKDSGTLLPGHGGVLDRIDALLLAAPVLWYAQLFKQWF